MRAADLKRRLDRLERMPAVSLPDLSDQGLHTAMRDEVFTQAHYDVIREEMEDEYSRVLLHGAWWYRRSWRSGTPIEVPGYWPVEIGSFVAAVPPDRAVPHAAAEVLRNHFDLLSAPLPIANSFVASMRCHAVLLRAVLGDEDAVEFRSGISDWLDCDEVPPAVELAPPQSVQCRLAFLSGLLGLRGIGPTARNWFKACAEIDRDKLSAWSWILCDEFEPYEYEYRDDDDEVEDGEDDFEDDDPSDPSDYFQPRQVEPPDLTTPEAHTCGHVTMTTLT